MSIKTKVITITPKDAERHIKSMVNNRLPNIRHITFLAAAMRRGEWDVTGQPVIFSDKNRLLDGQHRMRAVVASGCTVQMLAVYGIDESMFSKMDQGRGRSISDCIGTVPNKNNVAAAIRLIYSELKASKESLIHGGNHKPTNDEALAILADHQGIVNAVSFCTKYRRAMKMTTPAVIAYCLYRMRADNAAEANNFVARLDTGEGLSKRSPLLSLRNQLLDGRVNDGIRRRWHGAVIISSVACAWYMTLDGVTKPMKIESSADLWKGWRTNL